MRNMVAFNTKYLALMWDILESHIHLCNTRFAKNCDYNSYFKDI